MGTCISIGFVKRDEGDYGGVRFLVLYLLLGYQTVNKVVERISESLV